MNGTTHAIFGAAALAGFSLATGAEPPVWTYPVAAVAAWLPDVDNPRSTLGNGISPKKNRVLHLITRPLSLALRTVSFVLVRAVGHRTLTHSLFGLALFAVPVWLVLGAISPALAMAMIVGCASHLVADALNTPGVPLLWPLDYRFRLLPGGVRSGGLVEFAIAVAVLAAGAYAAYLVHPAIGGALGLLAF